MPKYQIVQVDAFTDQPLGGNPCAVVFDTDGMDDATMLAIAKEMNLSETAFVRDSQIADFGVRYFTPAEEIPLAGHPTIATTFALIDTRRLVLKENKTQLRLELKVGPIEVEISSCIKKRKGTNRIVETIVMSQMKPEFLSTHSAEVVMPIFGLSPGDGLKGVPIQTVSTGTPQLMIPVRDKEVLRRIQLDFPRYIHYRTEHDFFSPHLFCLEGITSEGRTFARHFGVPPDTPEDPFTGSATGGMAAYLWNHSLIDEPTFTAEQGHWMNRPGSASVEIIGPRDNIQTVKVGGKAVIVIRGELNL